VCLVVYHFQTGVYVGRVCRGEDDRTHVFYRVFNEVPVLFLFWGAQRRPACDN